MDVVGVRPGESESPLAGLLAPVGVAVAVLTGVLISFGLTKAVVGGLALFAVLAWVRQNRTSLATLVAASACVLDVAVFTVGSSGVQLADIALLAVLALTPSIIARQLGWMELALLGWAFICAVHGFFVASGASVREFVTICVAVLALVFGKACASDPQWRTKMATGFGVGLLVAFVVAILEARPIGGASAAILHALHSNPSFPTAATFTIGGRLGLDSIPFLGPEASIGGSLVLLGLPFVLQLAREQWPNRAYGMLAGIAILASMMAVSNQSREVLLVAAIGAIVVLARSPIRRKLAVLMGAVGLSALVGLFLAAEVGHLFHYELLSLVVYPKQSSSTRLQELYMAIIMGWQRSPWGAGLGGYAAMFGHFLPYVRNPSYELLLAAAGTAARVTNNWYAWVWSEQGPVGLLLWSVVLGSSLVRSLRARNRWDSVAVPMAVVAMFITASWEIIPWWLVVGYGLGLSEKHQ